MQHVSHRVGRALAYAVLHRVAFPRCIVQHARVAFCITSTITSFIFVHILAHTCIRMRAGMYAYGIKELDNYGNKILDKIPPGVL